MFWLLQPVQEGRNKLPLTKQYTILARGMVSNCSKGITIYYYKVSRMFGLLQPVQEGRHKLPLPKQYTILARGMVSNCSNGITIYYYKVSRMFWLLQEGRHKLPLPKQYTILARRMVSNCSNGIAIYYNTVSRMFWLLQLVQEGRDNHPSQNNIRFSHMEWLLITKRVLIYTTTRFLECSGCCSWCRRGGTYYPSQSNIRY